MTRLQCYLRPEQGLDDGTRRRQQGASSSSISEVASSTSRLRAPAPAFNSSPILCSVASRARVPAALPTGFALSAGGRLSPPFVRSTCQSALAQSQGMPPRSATWALLLAAAALSAATAAAAFAGGSAGQQGLTSGTASADADAAAGPPLKPLPQPPPEDAAGEVDNPHHKEVMAWADR